MALETMQAAITRLEGLGFVHAFHTSDGKLVCPICGNLHDPETVQVHEIVRFEGASDPDDEAAVFALECPECNVRGTWVVAYGPSMSADDAAVAPRLHDSRTP